MSKDSQLGANMCLRYVDNVWLMRRIKVVNVYVLGVRCTEKHRTATIQLNRDRFILSPSLGL